MSRPVLVLAQAGLLLGLFVLWHVLVRTEVLPAFFFGEPLVVLERVRDWFVSGSIWPHLGVTLLETVLAFVIGTVSGLILGFPGRWAFSALRGPFRRSGPGYSTQISP